MPAARLERLAVALWSQHRLEPGFDVDELVEACGLSFLWSPLDDAGGRPVAAMLSPRRRLIVLNERLRSLLDENMGFYRFSVAHEIGHWELHVHHTRAGGQVLGLTEGADAVLCRRLMFGADRPTTLPVDARQEHQADLFASYLLAPHDVFRAALAETGCDGWAETLRLATRLGLSGAATLVRLEEEGLAHRDADGQPRPGTRSAPGQVRFDW